MGAALIQIFLRGQVTFYEDVIPILIIEIILVWISNFYVIFDMFIKKEKSDLEARI